MISNSNVNYPFQRNSTKVACKNMINGCRTTTIYAGWTGNKSLEVKNITKFLHRTSCGIVFETIAEHFSKTY